MKILRVAAGVLAVVVLQTSEAQNRDESIHVLPVQGNVFMLVGPESNMTMQVGGDGVLLVDAMQAPMVRQIYSAIQQVSKQPIRYILNTDADSDHTGGNEGLSKLGKSRLGIGTGTNTVVNAAEEGAQIVAHENVLTRMSAPSGKQPSIPFSAWPTDTFVSGKKELFFNGEAVQIVHQPSAHTDGDSIVFFRRSDVISSGDIFVTTTYPVIDADKGGSIQGVIEGLNLIIDLAVPREKQEGGTYVIPGHGRLCDEADVVEYRDMVTILRDRVQDMIDRRMTLEQINSAKPTMDYDRRYGPPTKFVEAVFRSLSRSAGKREPSGAIK